MARSNRRFENSSFNWGPLHDLSMLYTDLGSKSDYGHQETEDCLA